jgi:hypothetical protein
MEYWKMSNVAYSFKGGVLRRHVPTGKIITVDLSHEGAPNEKNEYPEMTVSVFGGPKIKAEKLLAVASNKTKSNQGKSNK